MRPTPTMLAAAYVYLRETQPFKAWKLPPADKVRFGVCNSKKYFGYYRYWHEGRALQHEIALSVLKVRSPQNVLMTMAHEMTHLHQRTAARRDGKRRSVSHSPEFWQMASEICAVHGWPVNDF